jgi:hypoxanthine phosphoribosyltransferase
MGVLPPQAIDAHQLTSLVGASQIAHRVDEMARDIVADFSADLTLVVILKNGLVFAADLLRALGRTGARVAVEYACASGHEVKIVGGAVELTGRDVLVVDAILDTGRTALQVMDAARQAGAADVRLAVLLDRPSRQSIGPSADYTGFILPDRWVVGYGVDRDGAFRERSDVAGLD